MHHLNLTRRPVGEIEEATALVRTTIVDTDAYRLPVVQVGHQGIRAEGCRTVRRSGLIHIVDFTTSRRPPMKFLPVPRSNTDLYTGWWRRFCPQRVGLRFPRRRR